MTMYKYLIINLMFLALSVSCDSQEKKLVWADEFEEHGHPSSQKWNYEMGYVRNGEKQYYTDRIENVRVENGFLVIKALKENDGDSTRITSGSLTTKDINTWQYGKFEIRAKIPTGRGSWPALWMLGENIDEKGWPTCGEIDILENVGYDPDIIHGNIHTKVYNHQLGTNKGDTIRISKPYDDFHVYKVDWTESKIDFYVDDQLYFTFENDKKGNLETWPFSKPQFLIINLAVGGAWGGLEGVDENIFPLNYYIDYVRIYQ